MYLLTFFSPLLEEHLDCTVLYEKRQSLEVICDSAEEQLYAVCHFCTYCALCWPDLSQASKEVIEITRGRYIPITSLELLASNETEI